ncbi:hypothetical protein CC80DRAFT_521285 [Byssothecium circinans]|uniref:Uncharacterized protein n=1 Tax=Byssothecium circinans TaxID=147558 RepID=A0A6A5T8U8_9PLEO|nr:hypothetical protein CC80DRAFT_521285 [Byssothecium circinans]
MPVVVTPSPWKVGKNDDPGVSSATDLLSIMARCWSAVVESNPKTPIGYSYKSIPKGDLRVIQTSFRDTDAKSSLIPYESGFVTGIIRAFNQDLHLVLRPDDVWIAIVTQFSFFVKGMAEDLRSQFVTHQGKRELLIDATPFSLDDEMARLIDENTVDLGLKEWILPDFSTTTDNDRAVAAITLMGVMGSYFSYWLRAGCGFPSVTLLGGREDWTKLRRRIDRLPKYHPDTAEWAALLVPVIDGMYMVTPDTLSGWITAFCIWQNDGRHTHRFSDHKPESEIHSNGNFTVGSRKTFTLDGVTFPIISQHSLLKSVVRAKVCIQDANSKMEYDTTMIAGCVGMQVSDNDTRVQPISGWWMLEDSSRPLEACSEAPSDDESSGSGVDDCAFPAYPPEPQPVAPLSDEPRETLPTSESKRVYPIKRHISRLKREIFERIRLRR